MKFSGHLFIQRFSFISFTTYDYVQTFHLQASNVGEHGIFLLKAISHTGWNLINESIMPLKFGKQKGGSTTYDVK